MLNQVIANGVERIQFKSKFGVGWVSRNNPRTGIVFLTPYMPTKAYTEMPSDDALRGAIQRVNPSDASALSFAEVNKLVAVVWPDYDNNHALMRAYKAADSSGDGWIQLEEIPSLLMYAQYFVALWNKFDEMDKNRDGRFDLDEFKNGCQMFGLTIDNQDAEIEFATMDSDNSGYAEFEEFCSWIAQVQGSSREFLDTALQKMREEDEHEDRAIQADVGVDVGLSGADTPVLAPSQEIRPRRKQAKSGFACCATPERSSSRQPEALAALIKGSRPATVKEEVRAQELPKQPEPEPEPKPEPEPEPKSVLVGPTYVMPEKDERNAAFRQIDVMDINMLSFEELKQAVALMWPGFDDFTALARGYKATDLSKEGFVTRKEFRFLVQYTLYFIENAPQLSKIDADGGDVELAIDEFLHNCAVVGLQISDDDAETEFIAIEEASADGIVVFDNFCTFLAHLHTGQVPPPRRAAEPNVGEIYEPEQELEQPEPEREPVKPKKPTTPSPAKPRTPKKRTPKGKTAASPIIGGGWRQDHMPAPTSPMVSTGMNSIQILKQAMVAKRKAYGHSLHDTRAMFQHFDADDSGSLNRTEFKQVFTHLELGMTDVQMAEVICILDTNNDGQIDYEEFIQLLHSKIKVKRTGSDGGPVGDPETAVPQGCKYKMPSKEQRLILFKRIDGNDNGGLSLLEVDRVSAELWPTLNRLALIKGHAVTTKTAGGLVARRSFKQFMQLALYFDHYWGELTGAYSWDHMVGKDEFIRECAALNVKNSKADLTSAFNHLDTTGEGFVQWDALAACIVKLKIKEDSTVLASVLKPKAYKTNSAPRVAIGTKAEQSVKYDSSQKAQKTHTAVFDMIHSAMVNKRKLHGYTLEDARVLFQAMDTDGNNSIDHSEFKDGLNRLGLGLTSQQVTDVIHVLDPDGNDMIEYDALVQNLYLRTFSELRQRMKNKEKLFGTTISDTKALFAAMDRDGDGTLDAQEFWQAMRELKLGLSKKQVQELIDVMDTKHDGTIDYNRLVHHMYYSPKFTASVAAEVAPVPFCAPSAAVAKVVWNANQLDESEAINKGQMECLLPELWPEYDSEQHSAKLGRAFKAVDTDGVGRLDLVDFGHVLRSFKIVLNDWDNLVAITRKKKRQLNIVEFIAACKVCGLNLDHTELRHAFNRLASGNLACTFEQGCVYVTRRKLIGSENYPARYIETMLGWSREDIAAHRLQTRWRGYVTRDTLRAGREALQGITLIQAQWRGHLARKDMAVYFTSVIKDENAKATEDARDQLELTREYKVVKECIVRELFETDPKTSRQLCTLSEGTHVHVLDALCNDAGKLRMKITMEKSYGGGSAREAWITASNHIWVFVEAVLEGSCEERAQTPERGHEAIAGSTQEVVEDRAQVEAEQWGARQTRIAQLKQTQPTPEAVGVSGGSSTVRRWLASKKLDRYEGLFFGAGWTDLQEVKNMSEDDIQALGIHKKVHVIKLRNALAELRSSGF